MTYVITRNGGYEGHSPPLIAIADRGTALTVLEFMKASGESGFVLFEVPEWPSAPNKWWDTKPLPPAHRPGAEKTEASQS